MYSVLPLWSDTLGCKKVTTFDNDRRIIIYILYTLCFINLTVQIKSCHLFAGILVVGQPYVRSGWQTRFAPSPGSRNEVTTNLTCDVPGWKKIRMYMNVLIGQFGLIKTLSN